MHPAVVDEAQAAVALAVEQVVDLAGVDEPAEEVGDLAPAMPRVVVLKASRVGLEEQLGRAGGLDLVVDRGIRLRLIVAGEPHLLAVEHEARPGFEDVGRLGEQAGVLGDGHLAPAGHEDDLDVRAMAGLERAHAGEREAVVAAAHERAVGAEQGAVEIDVEGAHGPTSCRMAVRDPAFT